MPYTDVGNIRPGFLLTAGWLQNERACPNQSRLFEIRYPKGMRITTRNLNIARSKHRLTTRWFIDTVLGYDEYRKLRTYADANPSVAQWTLKNARLFHAAFIRILKERG